MSKLRFLRLKFDKPIMAWEIPYFRASVIEQSERKSNLFHNHKSDTEVIYRYPLIQYKIMDKCPAIICIKAGTDDIHYLLENKDFYFDINGKVDKYEIDHLYLKYFNIQTWDRKFRYNVHNYMPFNQENYAVYKKLGSEKRKLAFTEEMINTHLRVLLEGLDIDYSNIPIEAEIEKINGERYIEYKNTFHLTYSINIKANVTLPNYIGLGKAVASGFGSIKQLSDHNGRSQ